ncbi:hypothetical protein MTO96_020711 [Rhipicephalus appendiculatus]
MQPGQAPQNSLRASSRCRLSQACALRGPTYYYYYSHEAGRREGESTERRIDLPKYADKRRRAKEGEESAAAAD